MQLLFGLQLVVENKKGEIENSYYVREKNAMVLGHQALVYHHG